MFELVLVIAAAVVTISVLIVALSLEGKWQGGKRVSLSTVATKYEGSLLGLARVTIVVPRIEDPSEDPELRAAVIRNFGRNVKYIFIVSKDKFDAERDGYYRMFESYARHALRQIHDDASIVNKLVDELVTIVPMKRRWPHHPYIFYHCVVGPTRYTFAVRGLQREQGITDMYLTVASEEAAAIYSGVVQSVEPEYAYVVTESLVRVDPIDFDLAPEKPETVASDEGVVKIAGVIDRAK